jgi:hypothetical protein
MMAVSPITLAGFLDELTKIAASHGRMHMTKSRAGRRPMRVDTMLKKEKDGTLWKEGDSQGNPQDTRGSGADDPGAAKLPKRAGETPTKDPNSPMESKLGEPVRGDNNPIPNGEQLNFNPEAKKPRKKGDVPSMDDVNVVDRFDGRGEATTAHGLGQSSMNIGATNQPAEHS